MKADYRHSNRLNNTSLYWLLGLVGLVQAPHIIHMPFWISLVAGSALLLRMFSSIDLARLSRRLLLAALVIITSTGVYLEYGTLLGLQSGVSLFVIMLSFKVIETRSLRDGMLVTCLACFMLITHFLYNQSIPIALYTIVMCVVIGMTMMQLNKRNASFDAIYQFKSVAFMLLQSLPLVLVLFVLFPRLSGPIWALPNDAGSGITGLSDTMTPGNISNLTQSGKVAFRVEFEGEPPPPEQRYWRGPVLWNFDGRTWRVQASNRRASPLEVTRTDDKISYQVTLEPHGKRWLFALDIPDSIPANSILSSDYQLLTANPLKKRNSYRVTSRLNYSINRKLGSYERSLALRLPQQGAQKAKKLALEWHRQSDNTGNIVNNALEHFRNNDFFYTLTPTALGSDPVDEFLFNTRQGFCEHYASSFVVLMRAAGVPARVVTGYSGGEWNPLGNYMLVRQSDAHAWAEVWIRDKGWVRIDPTAAVAPERVLSGIGSALSENSLLPFFVRASHSGGMLSRLNLLWDNINYHWNAWVLSYGPDSQRALLSWLGNDSTGWQTLIIWMTISVSGFLILYTLLFLILNRIIASDPLSCAYMRLCNKIARTGIARETYEGPMAYAQRIRETKPEIGARIEPLLGMYAQLKYSQQFSRQSLKEFERQIRNLRVV